MLKSCLVKLNHRMSKKNRFDEMGNMGLDTIEKKETIAEIEGKFITDVSQDIAVKDLSYTDKDRSEESR